MPRPGAARRAAAAPAPGGGAGNGPGSQRASHESQARARRHGDGHAGKPESLTVTASAPASSSVIGLGRLGPRRPTAHGSASPAGARASWPGFAGVGGRGPRQRNLNASAHEWRASESESRGRQSDRLSSNLNLNSA